MSIEGIKRPWFSTPALDITNAPADENHRGPFSIMCAMRIVIHDTEGLNSLPWLTTTSRPPVSIHRYIDRTGRIYKVVEDSGIAWHVGKSVMLPGPHHHLISCNLTSLGIELERAKNDTSAYPEAQLSSAASQVVEWWGAHGYLPVVGHGTLDTGKTDPGYFPWNEFLGMVIRRTSRLIG